MHLKMGRKSETTFARPRLTLQGSVRKRRKGKKKKKKELEEKYQTVLGCDPHSIPVIWADFLLLKRRPTNATTTSINIPQITAQSTWPPT